ncbi:MAG: hypothetical protein R3C14_39850 [Caldilineaceae bacterium]
MHKKQIQIPAITLKFWWPEGTIVWQKWLPSRGNVLFTLLVISILFWAQNVGAISLGAPLAASISTAGIPYQGRLADSNGNPLTQTVNITFRLYAAASGGTPLWEEGWTGANSVQVSDGLFNVMLGSVNPIGQAVITGNGNLFLGITVGTDSEMNPRVQLGNVPFATQALTVPDGSITKAKLAPDAIGGFGGRPTSYPYITHLNNFQLYVGNFNNGYAPGDSGSAWSVVDGVNGFTDGLKFFAHSGTGVVSAHINGPDNTNPRWGYAYTFFLNNQSAARNITLSVSTCNDVVMSTLQGNVSADKLGTSGTQVYHRYPGNASNPNLAGCPCETISPTVQIPDGNFRLNFMTRGASCMSYFSLSPNWITDAQLTVDWPSLRTYLGEE